MMSSTDALDWPNWGQAAADAIVAVLGANLRGLYVFGSTVSGGRRPSSDLDLLAIVETPVDRGACQALCRELLTRSSWSADTRSGRPIDLTVLVRIDLVPWRYPPRKCFQYGEWLRPEIERGEIAPLGDDPDVAIQLASAQARSAPLRGPPLAALTVPVPPADLRRAIGDALPSLLQGLHGDECNVVLTLARMWVTASCRDIVPKDMAADRVLAWIDPIHRPILLSARAAYRGEIDDDWSARQSAVRIFVDAITAEIRRALEADGRLHESEHRAHPAV